MSAGAAIDENSPTPVISRWGEDRAVPPKLWLWFLALEALFASSISLRHSLGDAADAGVSSLDGVGRAGAGLGAARAVGRGGDRLRHEAQPARTPRSHGGSSASACFLFITGDTTYKFWHQIIGNNQIPFPSFIDAIYVTMYPVLAIGLLLLARARVRGGDRASILDALTITLGMGLLSWIFLIGPNVRARRRRARETHRRRLPARRRSHPGDAGAPVELRRPPPYGGAAPRHRRARDARGRLVLRPSPICTRAGTGATATRSTSAGSSSTPAGAPPRCTRPCGALRAADRQRRRERATPGSFCSRRSRSSRPVSCSSRPPSASLSTPR